MRVVIALVLLGLFALAVHLNPPDPAEAAREWAALHACLEKARTETARYVCWYAPGSDVE